VITSRRITWVGDLAHIGETRKAYKSSVTKPDGKKPLGRPDRRWQNDLREIGRLVEWIHVAQDRNQWLSAVNTVMDLWVP
jgi:hypothetical protein